MSVSVGGGVSDSISGLTQNHCFAQDTDVSVFQAGERKEDLKHTEPALPPLRVSTELGLRHSCFPDVLETIPGPLTSESAEAVETNIAAEPLRQSGDLWKCFSPGCPSSWAPSGALDMGK